MNEHRRTVLRRVALGIGLPVALATGLAAVVAKDQPAPDTATGTDDPGARELILSASGEGEVLPTPEQEVYQDGDQVTIEASPADGWEFEGWTGGHSGNENPATVTMWSARRIRAHFTEIPDDEGAPEFELWDGSTLTAGDRGQPQQWLNIRGRVSDPDDVGVAALSYRLNDDSPKRFNFGPDNRRLSAPGDFNIEIDYADLQTGANDLRLYAIDHHGEERAEIVTINYEPAAPELPFQTDWSDDDVVDVAYPVDGRWSTRDGAIEPTEPGYDRTLALGDIDWADYEVTVPITMGERSDEAGTGVGGDALVGVAPYWPGHAIQDSEAEQPRIGAFEFGAFASYIFASDGGRFELYGTDREPLESSSVSWAVGETYMLKVRAETTENRTEFAFKFWPAGSAEPAGFDLEILHDHGPRSGGVLLVAHHLSATFGDVVVTPL